MSLFLLVREKESVSTNVRIFSFHAGQVLAVRGLHLCVATKTHEESILILTRVVDRSKHK
jgi:hypothetical protein